jgi:hypothetical protein
MKRQSCSCLVETQTIIGMLREIEHTLELMAREMARQSKRNGR